MAFRDILLVLTSYPEPTPVSVVEEAVSVAAAARRAYRGALLRNARSGARPFHFGRGGRSARSRRRRSRQEPKKCPGPAGSVRRGRGEGRRFPRIDAREMQVVRGAGPAGRICAASRSHDHAGTERPMVRRGRDFRLRQADPDPAARSAIPSVRTRDRRGRLGFQPRGRSRGIGGDAAVGKGEAGCAWSPFSTRSGSTASIPPRNCRRTCPGTASTSCSTGSTPRAGRSATCSRPMSPPTGLDHARHGRVRTLPSAGIRAGWRNQAACCRKPPLPILFSH